MSTLLTGIGTRIAERWLQTVVLAGLLWIAALVIAVRLGHTHPFDAGRLTAWLDEIARDRAGQSTSATLLVAAAVLLAAGAAGLAAGALGGVFQRLWGAAGTGPVLSWVLRRRRARRLRRIERARRSIARAGLHHGRGARLLLSHAGYAARRRKVPEPVRPTRIGDVFHGVAVRVRRRYALDLEPTWPRLWALLPETLRADLVAARQAYDAAARLAGWALLYAALALLWWPAAPIAAAVLATAVVRARDAASLLAVLVESSVDLHLTDLAERLGVSARDGEEVVTATELGRAITNHLAGLDGTR
ncbi:hypothetical protein OG946_24145 [Streptomyces sp. NBC_01808]|uniref:hypothetical protein n=1 Tax=Streptomyces sp. NBC_01808 TaxID=2975947 RepID=UPI002DDABDBC|nr:hypothetical protein [Streptomyces sp. NBC_01808]WSA40185.1 hypothetical protein OG946_24145 [Streptomyces sp. NBC_01808]